MYDRLLALFALAVFGIFLGIIGWRVQEWDLRIVLLIAFAMASYDFWRDAISSQKENKGENGK